MREGRPASSPTRSRSRRKEAKHPNEHRRWVSFPPSAVGHFSSDVDSMSSCNAPSPSAPSSCTRSAPSQASGLRPSASEPGRTPMQESRDRASSDGRAPLVASLLESARTKGRKMLCASPDHQLVHVQAAVCGPQNRQYQTSGTTCRIRVQSLNEARAEGKDGNDLALFKEAVEQAQAQLRLHRQNLAAAEREQTNAAHAWSAMQEVLDETRNIAAGWDKLTIKERSFLFRHWVAAVFSSGEKIPDRKRVHRKHAVCYLAGTPRLSGEVVDASANAASISSITTWSVSVDSALVNATTADADPMRPRAHAECDRTSGSGSDSPDFSDGTAASSPQFPNATATF